MPVYLTVQQFQKEYSEHIKEIHIKTVYRWIDEGKPTLKKIKDHGGRGWLIVIDEDDFLFPFLVRQPKHITHK